MVMDKLSKNCDLYIRIISEHLAPETFNKIARIHPLPESPTSNIHFTYAKCQECRLSEIRTNAIVGAGNYNAEILVIGEAPGPDEDIVGVPFIGRAGKLIRDVFTKMEIEKNVYYSNAVACIPKDTKESSFRAPEVSEIKACSKRLDEVINLLPNLKAVILLGKTAHVAFLHKDDIEKKLRTIKMSEIIGFNKKYEKYSVYTNYHPSYIERQGKPKELMQSWINTFKEILKELKNAKG